MYCRRLFSTLAHVMMYMINSGSMTTSKGTTPHEGLNNPWLQLLLLDKVSWMRNETFKEGQSHFYQALETTMMTNNRHRHPKLKLFVSFIMWWYCACSWQVTRLTCFNYCKTKVLSTHVTLLFKISRKKHYIGHLPTSYLWCVTVYISVPLQPLAPYLNRVSSMTILC